MGDGEKKFKVQGSRFKVQGSRFNVKNTAAVPMRYASGIIPNPDTSWIG